MKIELTQYLRPDGRTRQIWLDDAPDDLKPFVAAIKKCKCNLAVEELTTGEASFTIEYPYPSQAEDFDIEICPNGPGTRDALYRLLRRFDVKNFKAWAREIDAADDGLGVGWGT